MKSAAPYCRVVSRWLAGVGLSLLLSAMFFSSSGFAQDAPAKKKPAPVVDVVPPLRLDDSDECLQIGRVSGTMFRVPKHYDLTQPLDVTMDLKSLDPTNIKNLRVAYFSPNVPTSRQRGTVVIIMGRAEYIENYCDVISYLRGNRYGVLIYDLRGQGMSDRILPKKEPHFYDKGYVDNYQDYVNDHNLLIANFRSSLIRPLYLIGHSLGGHVALQIMLQEQAKLDADKQYRTPYKKIVVLAPLWKLHGEWAMRPLLSTMGYLAGGDAFFPTQGPYRPAQFFLNKKTHSAERFYRYNAMIAKKKSLRLGGVTYQWLRATLASNDDLWQQVMVDKKLIGNTIPLLEMNAVGDRVVDAATAKQMGQNIGNNTLVDLPDYKHALLQEDNPRLQKVFDIMIDFFNQK
ncbi:MAG: alpha/beta hydrolase [Hydrotalea sp.]|nr:alpha/beta hydrolase [Hydrotalea sp.]